MNNKPFLVISAAFVTWVFGCGNRDTYQNSDGKIKVERKDGISNFAITTEEGQANVTMSDTGIAIPDTFPKDVPILKGAVAMMSMNDGQSEMLHLQVPGKIADVTKALSDKLKEEGWKIESTMNMGEASMLQALKGNRECTAMVTKENTGTLVQLTVSKE